MIRSASRSSTRFVFQVINCRQYHEKVIDHYENPRNVGSLDPKDPSVGTGMVGAPACGDVMKLQIKVNDEGKIVDARFKTFGCGSAIASSSYATEYIKGKSMEQAKGVRNNVIAQELRLPPIKLHCSMLAEDAIKAAIDDYQKKNMKKEKHPTYGIPPQKREQSPASAIKRSCRSTLLARFIPIAVETLGCLGKEADYFLFPTEKDATGDRRSSSFLLQRISAAIKEAAEQS
ncbi:hypothetical protein ACOME3_006178 [Neoechinorhynchus agilis]